MLQKPTFVICALPFPGHIGIDWKLAEKQSAFRNQGLISHSEETKKGKIFVILSQLKKLSKSNDVNAQKCFLIIRHELLLPLKIRVTEGGNFTFLH